MKDLGDLDLFGKTKLNFQLKVWSNTSIFRLEMHEIVAYLRIGQWILFAEFGFIKRILFVWILKMELFAYLCGRFEKRRRSIHLYLVFYNAYGF